MSDSVVFDGLVVSSAKDLGHEPIQRSSGNQILDNRLRIGANRFLLFCNKRNSLRSLPQRSNSRKKITSDGTKKTINELLQSMRRHCKAQ